VAVTTAEYAGFQEWLLEVKELADDSSTCPTGECPGWLPKQGRDALYAAMEKDGWDYFISRKQAGRSVLFIKPIGGDWAQGEDTDDWRAAAKALRAAGY